MVAGMSKRILMLSAGLFTVGVVLTVPKAGALLTELHAFALATAASGNAAAWVQAVGSIAAIVAAGGIAAVQHRHAMRLMQAEDKRRKIEREEDRRNVAGALLSEMLAAANKVGVIFDVALEGTRIDREKNAAPGIRLSKLKNLRLPERRVLPNLGHALTRVSQEALQSAILFDASLQNLDRALTQVADDIEAGDAARVAINRTSRSVGGLIVPAGICRDIAKAVAEQAKSLRGSLCRMAAEAEAESLGDFHHIASMLDGLSGRL